MITPDSWTVSDDPFLVGDPITETDPPAVAELIVAGLPHCGRPFNHRRHEYLDGDCHSHWCPGGAQKSRPAAVLVHQQPSLAGVGVVPAIAELGTWCA